MNRAIRNVASWSIELLSAQWDLMAPSRDAQLRSNRDVSFELVLKPTVLNLLKEADISLVLDAGCGSGVLTEHIADLAGSVTGVDMSQVHIDLAVGSASRRANTRYFSETLESYLSRSSDRFTTVVANMVLQDTADLKGCLTAIASRCLENATLIATITHPWFWPTYWEYDKEAWFDYSAELAIEAPFRISTDTEAVGVTTHFHRSLSRYMAELHDAGFALVDLIEPVPSMEIQSRYPSVWRFPRFLAFRCHFTSK